MDLFDFGNDPALLPVSEVELVAFDFETTGLYPDSDRVVEIGAVKSMGGKVLDEYSTLVDPEMVVPSDASRVSGITTEMVAGQPVFAEIAEPFLNFIGSAVLVAHNLPFDLGFLTHELERVGKDPTGNTGVDSCILARRTMPRMRSYSLAKLSAALGIDAGNSHRALDDARSCLKLFEQCVARIDNDPQMGKVIELGAHPDLHR